MINSSTPDSSWAKCNSEHLYSDAVIGNPPGQTALSMWNRLHNYRCFSAMPDRLPLPHHNPPPITPHPSRSLLDTPAPPPTHRPLPTTTTTETYPTKAFTEQPFQSEGDRGRVVYVDVVYRLPWQPASRTAICTLLLQLPAVAGCMSVHCKHCHCWMSVHCKHCHCWMSVHCKHCHCWVSVHCKHCRCCLSTVNIVAGCLSTVNIATAGWMSVSLP